MNHLKSTDQITCSRIQYNQGTFKNTIHSIVMFIVFISAIWLNNTLLCIPVRKNGRAIAAKWEVTC